MTVEREGNDAGVRGKYFWSFALGGMRTGMDGEKSWGFENKSEGRFEALGRFQTVGLGLRFCWHCP